MKPVQQGLMAAYRLARRAGLLQVAPVRAAVDASYGVYKQLLEAPYIAALRPLVVPGSIVIDVGANVGFFTARFARWTGAGGRVLAIEPEARNFEQLRALVARRGLDAIVRPVHAAAAEQRGELRLAVDHDHPGGHFLAADGVPTPAVTIDDLMLTETGRRVSLIKIDVQGAELRVLEGARDTLAASRPALLVEMDEGGLRQQRASIAAVVDLLTSAGYRGRFVGRGGPAAAMDPAPLIAACLTHDYVDVLFLHGG